MKIEITFVLFYLKTSIYEKLIKDLRHELSAQKLAYEEKLKANQVQLSKAQLQIAFQEGKITVDI